MAARRRISTKICARDGKGVKKLAAKRGNRTFTGCWNCRARKVKCDELQPACTPCTKTSIECFGYQSNLVWVTPDQKYIPGGRRLLRCDLTWADWSLLSETQQDHFISLCEAAEICPSLPIEWVPRSGVPFGVFPSKNNLPAWPIPRCFSSGMPLDSEEAFLFRHYVTHVASLMMPYKHVSNPFESLYPAVAIHKTSLAEQALYKGLLAQSALNLANLGCSREQLMLKAGRYYTSAVGDLRQVAASSQMEYSSFLAAVLTLMYAETYAGHANTWRAHFDGAWAICNANRSLMPWASSDLAWTCTQSLCIITVMSNTAQLPSPQGSENSILERIATDTTHPNSISTGTAFGYTIGATQLLLMVITDIHKMGNLMKSNSDCQITDEAASSLYNRIQKCQELCNGEKGNMISGNGGRENSQAPRYHLQAFISATSIFLYRTLFDLPPSFMRSYVREVFYNMKKFFEAGGGNFSLWPAFIASIEAYEADDHRAAKEWLQISTKVGMGNRYKIAELVEEVWRRREKCAQERWFEPGSISIDWREVMVELKLDILLV